MRSVQRKWLAGYILTCQAHPISKRVVIDYNAV